MPRFTANCSAGKTPDTAAVAALAVTTPVLWQRMRRDFLGQGRLRTSTAAWMWATYAAHAALTARALINGPTGRWSSSAVRVTGVALTAVGAAVDMAGIRGFAGPGQLTGTAAGDLVTGGIYRYSRHPQYLGIITALTGLAILRRSTTALALTAALPAAYRAWAPVEEDHLAQQFGEHYRRYQAATPRWLGAPAPSRVDVPAPGSMKGVP